MPLSEGDYAYRPSGPCKQSQYNVEYCGVWILPCGSGVLSGGGVGGEFRVGSRVGLHRLRPTAGSISGFKQLHSCE